MDREAILRIYILVEDRGNRHNLYNMAGVKDFSNKVTFEAGSDIFLVALMILPAYSALGLIQYYNFS